MRSILAIILVCASLAGCTSTVPVSAAGTCEPADRLGGLASLERVGSWQRAFIGYREILADSSDAATAEAARLGAVRCLIGMEHYHAALAMLEPLPVDASDESDRRRLALAAETMLRLGVSVHAESLAEVALSGREPGVGSDRWAAACSANLAKAYLDNDKPARSAAMYRSASRLFQSADRPQAATECMALALEIETALGQRGGAP